MLNGKTALITGGAGGIGRFIAEKFTRSGVSVLIADINVKAGVKAASDLSRHKEALFFKCDISKETQVKKLISFAAARFGKIDIIVNNAGFGDWRSMEKRPMKAWDRVLAVNLTAQYMLVKYALLKMSEGGAVINISSTRALMSEPGSEPYAASKAGILGMTHSLASSLAPKRIRVNAISPGWINVSGYRETKRDREQHFVKRVGRGEDIAEACVFLADAAKSGFITGQNLVVDGGMTKKMIYL